MLLTEQTSRFLADTSWAAQFGGIENQVREEWGAVSTVRVFYKDGPEVEFNFAEPDWLAEPLDPGTRRVLAGAYRVLLNQKDLPIPKI
jgi:hypothetical protein